jgi:hypothetical protein
MGGRRSDSSTARFMVKVPSMELVKIIYNEKEGITHINTRNITL